MVLQKGTWVPENLTKTIGADVAAPLYAAWCKTVGPPAAKLEAAFDRGDFSGGTACVLDTGVFGWITIEFRTGSTVIDTVLFDRFSCLRISSMVGQMFWGGDRNLFDAWTARFEQAFGIGEQQLGPSIEDHDK